MPMPKPRPLRFPLLTQGADEGRATKWAAMALLLKAQLWDEKWADAKTTAENIVNNSGIQLFPDFGANFDLAHENKGERLFEAQVSAAANASQYQVHSAHFNPEDYPSQLGGAGWSWLSATQEFRASYDAKDKRISTLPSSNPIPQAVSAKSTATTRW